MKLKLIYDRSNVTKPVLSEAILKLGILVNVLEARVTAASGEMIIDAPAKDKELAAFISLLHDEGLIVKELTETLEIDRELCTACGACVSPCPTEAITLKSNWDIEFNDSKCVRCNMCVNICPVKAIKLTG